jgi:hypothetical protein
LAKEFDICPLCGAVVANAEMHKQYHQWLRRVITKMNQMLQIVWTDANLDQTKREDPPPAPDGIDY